MAFIVRGDRSTRSTLKEEKEAGEWNSQFNVGT